MNVKVVRGTANAGRSADEARFAVLYARCYQPIHDYCSRRLAHDVVDDAVADVFLTVWRRLKEVPPGEEAVVWMYAVAYRVVGHQWRSSARRGRLQSRLQAAEVCYAAPSDDVVIGHDEQRLALEALSRVGDTAAEVLRLTAWERLSVAEIGAVLGIEPNAVRQRIHRARRSLARQYGRLESTPTSTSGLHGGGAQ